MMTDATPSAAESASPPSPAPAAPAAGAVPESPPPSAAPAAPSSPAPAASWRDGITDEKVKELAGRYNSPADMAKAQLELRQKLSTAIIPPGKDAKPEEIAAYRERIGVPAAPEAYKFEMAGEPTEADKAFQSTMASVFHANNITAEQAAGLNKAWNEFMSKTQEARVLMDKKHAEDSMKALKDNWGAEFDQNLTFANRMVAHAFAEDLEAARHLETKDGQFILDHPIFIKAFARFGREMREDGLNGAMTETESSQLNHAIKAADAEYYKAYYSGDRIAAQAADQKRQALYAKAHGSGPIVGNNSRAA